MGSDTSFSTLGTDIDGTEISIASQAEGDILYFNGTNWVRLAKGSALQVLRQNAALTAPEYATLTNATILIEKKVLVSDATTVTFNTDISSDDVAELILVADMNNTSGSNAAISLYVQGDTTATNYYTERGRMEGASIGVGNANNAIMEALYTGTANVLHITLTRDRVGKLCAKYTMHFNTGANVSFTHGVVQSKNAIANITTITLSASVANAFETGSIFSLYKRVFS